MVRDSLEIRALKIVKFVQDTKNDVPFAKQ